MQPQKLGYGFWARALPKRAGHQAIRSGTEGPGGLPDKGGGQGGGGRPGLQAPPGWRRSWDRGEEGAVPGAPQARAAPSLGPTPTHHCQYRPHLGRPSGRRRGGLPGGRGRPQTHSLVTTAGAEERPGALGACSRESSGGGIPPLPLPGRGAPPRPRHLGEPRPVSTTWGSPASAAAVSTGSPGTAAPPISSWPHGLSVAPLHFRRGTPAPVLAHLTRTQFRAFRGLSHSLL